MFHPIGCYIGWSPWWEREVSIILCDHRTLAWPITNSCRWWLGFRRSWNVIRWVSFFWSWNLDNHPELVLRCSCCLCPYMSLSFLSESWNGKENLQNWSSVLLLFALPSSSTILQCKSTSIFCRRPLRSEQRHCDTSLVLQATSVLPLLLGWAVLG